MRYTVTITGQVETNMGRAAIVRDAGWVLEQADHRIVPGTVSVIDVQAVPESTPDPVQTAVESALADLTEFELERVAGIIAALRTAR